jgi:hypothetical protein
MDPLRVVYSEFAAEAKLVWMRLYFILGTDLGGKRRLDACPDNRGECHDTCDSRIL